MCLHNFVKHIKLATSTIDTSASIWTYHGVLVHNRIQIRNITILDSPVLFPVERLDNCHTPQNTILVWISIWFDRKSLIFRMKAQSEQRVGSDEGGGQGRCRWWRVVSWSCPQVIWTVRRSRKQHQRYPSADFQRFSLCTILYHSVPFAFDEQPLATECCNLRESHLYAQFRGMCERPR